MDTKKKQVIVKIILCIGISIGITLLAVACQPNPVRDMLQRFLNQPLLFVMNFIPIFLLTVALGALLGNVCWGGAVVNLVVCVMSIASRIKVEVRDEALLPRDFLLLREVGEAVNSYEIDFPWKIIAVVGLFCVGLIFTGIVLKSDTSPNRIRRQIGKCYFAFWMQEFPCPFCLD